MTQFGEHEHFLALLGEPCAALAAVEQRRVEQQLQFLHPFGHGRLGGVQFQRRLGKNAQPGDSEQRFQLLESHHLGTPSAETLIASLF